MSGLRRRTRVTWPALVAPFIADFVLSTAVPCTELCECGTCTTRWFADRFTQPEVDRLYSGYRGDEYFRVRHRYEPWYTEATNRGIGADPKRLDARREGLTEFLAGAGFRDSFRAVLDYGGDAGQFIPLQLAEHAFVYEVSGVAPVPGVSAVTAETDLLPGGYDLVLLSHVLEHISDPLALVRVLVGLPCAESGLVYVEVPLERPRLGLIGRGRMSAAYLDQLRRRALLLRAVDFYSTALRVRAGVIPPLGFAKLHEHQNFFSPDGLRRILTRGGFDVLRVEQVAGHGMEGGGASIAALARVGARA